jgi:hypothetical protein
MVGHSRRWYQRVFLTEGWACLVCDFKQIYTSPTDLLPHLESAHADQFNMDQLHAISRQGVVVRPRRWNECPVCGFTVEEAQEHNSPEYPKRQGGHLQGASAKMARTTLESGIPSRHRGGSTVTPEAPSSDSDVESSDSDEGAPANNESHNAIVMARHIAAHHQVLMLLTIRFAAMLNAEDEFNDYDSANSLDIYGSVDQSGTGRIERVSSLASDSISEPFESRPMSLVDSIPDTLIDLRKLLDGDDEHCIIPDVVLGPEQAENRSDAMDSSSASSTPGEARPGSQGGGEGKGKENALTATVSAEPPRLSIATVYPSSATCIAPDAEIWLVVERGSDSHPKPASFTPFRVALLQKSVCHH